MERVALSLQEHFPKSCSPKILEPINKQKKIKTIYTPISLGELIDKITILQIKTNHIKGSALENVTTELNALQGTLNSLDINFDPMLVQQLKKVNQDLWQIEDAIREQERQKNFDNSFIQLARSVYQKNDHRAALKKINITYGSALIEEKSYNSY